MAELRLHGRPVGTVFDLLGEKEDDITYSLGWALAQSDALARALLRKAFDEEADAEDPARRTAAAFPKLAFLDPLPSHSSCALGGLRQDPPIAETGYEIAFDASKDALKQQEAALDNLRTRASTVLSGASIATAFLGAQALKRPRHRPELWLDGWEWVAAGSFIALALTVIVILWPRKNWVFTVGAKDLIGGYVEGARKYTVPEIQRNLALHLENHFDANQQKIERLYLWFRLSCGLLALQVVAWILDLTTGG